MNLVDAHTLGASLFYLIGLLLAAGLGAAALIGVWTLLKIVIWKSQRRRAEAEYRDKRRAADGKPLPPVTRGICEACGAQHAEVLHLSTGERLCRAHYAARHGASAGGAAAP